MGRNNLAQCQHSQYNSLYVEDTHCWECNVSELLNTFRIIHICNPISPTTKKSNSTVGLQAKTNPSRIFSVTPPVLYSLYHQTLANTSIPAKRLVFEISSVLKYTVSTSRASIQSTNPGLHPLFNPVVNSMQCMR